MGGWVKKHGVRGWLVGVASLAFVGWSSSAFGQAPSLTLIGIPPGRVDSVLVGISADGTTGIGSAFDATTGYRGLSWTRAGGVNEWGSLPGVPTGTQGTAVSANGSVIAGTRVFGIRSTAFRYDAGGYQALGTLPAPFTDSGSTGISGDGSIIVGSMNGGGQAVATRWTAATGLQNVGQPAGTIGAGFTGLSRDGSTAIGISAPDFNGNEAYSWTQAGGWRHLPAPAVFGQNYDARTAGTNLDGSLIVGTVYAVRVFRPSAAVLWRNGAPFDIGSLGSSWHMGATAVSDDGSVIVGGGTNFDTGRSAASVWLSGGGPLNLQDYLASFGITTPAGWTLVSCRGVSADGMTIAGIAQQGNTTQGFVATIPSPGPVSLGIVFLGTATARRRRAAVPGAVGRGSGRPTRRR